MDRWLGLARDTSGARLDTLQDLYDKMCRGLIPVNENVIRAVEDGGSLPDIELERLWDMQGLGMK